MSIAIPWQKEVLLDIWNRLVNKFVSKKKTKEQNRWVRKPLCTFTNQYRFKRFFFFSPIYYTDVTLNDIAYFKRLFILVMKKKKKKKKKLFKICNIIRYNECDKEKKNEI